MLHLHPFGYDTKGRRSLDFALGEDWFGRTREAKRHGKEDRSQVEGVYLNEMVCNPKG